MTKTTEPHIAELIREDIELPEADNTSEGLKILRAANEHFRQVPWPSPYNRTTHTLRRGDARDLSHIEDDSVHLIVTSPPYWTLKEYPAITGQLGAIEAYDAFLDELDKVWRECARVLVPGGRICCVVGDVCVPRRRLGKHFVKPLHADIPGKVSCPCARRTYTNTLAQDRKWRYRGSGKWCRFLWKALPARSDSKERYRVYLIPQERRRL